MEYAGGAVWSAEPRLNNRNLNAGEQAQGWRWFVLPSEVEPVEIVFGPPVPQFRLMLPPAD